MAVELDLSKPLDAETVAKLRQRYSNEYVDRMISLAGGVEEQADEPDGDEPDGSSDGSTPSEDPNEGEQDEDEDDLIGDATGNAVGATFDPADYTVDEVLRHLKGVSLEERNAVLQLERDGRQRSSILNYFAS